MKLETERLILRKIEKKDLPELVKNANKKQEYSLCLSA